MPETVGRINAVRLRPRLLYRFSDAHSGCICAAGTHSFSLEHKEVACGLRTSLVAMQLCKSDGTWCLKIIHQAVTAWEKKIEHGCCCTEVFILFYSIVLCVSLSRKDLDTTLKMQNQPPQQWQQTPVFFFFVLFIFLFLFNSAFNKLCLVNQAPVCWFLL